MTVLVVNGPNLDRLGTREPDVYGATTYADLEELCRDEARRLGFAVRIEQSNAESQIIEWLHEAADTASDVVLNAAGFTHTSVAIGDACAMLTGRLVEVHISNVFARESFRHHSYVSPHASGVIVGCGVNGYRLALQQLAAG
ncbi:MAG TPA: type II 3-dehydroquinate dehydratase [Candidatus Stackebrandtia excrementipullorum]|nr:type II 3-dehydroquinate dehydratase [Candidatus Stackebrandtia excrementipullorum]